MILLKNATLVHLDPPEIREGVDVTVEGSRIASVGPMAAEKTGGRAEHTIDLAGRILMPGLVCGHNHFYSGLARGILARIEPSTDFVSTLSNLWWKLDRALDRETLSAGALICCVEAIRAGCTAVVDHHASPSFIQGSLEALRRCFEQAGLRGVLCYETTDRNGARGMEEGIEENLGFARAVEARRKAGQKPLVEAMIGGHAPFTLPDAALEALGRAAAETGRGFHVHVSEDGFDPSFSHRVHGKDPLARLDAHGLLSGRTVIAHGVHLTDAERELLERRRCFLAHNARSNMNNHVGYAAALPRHGNVVLGTDGIGSDMLEETKMAYFKHRDAGGPLWPADFLRMLQNGNTLLAGCFGERFGRIEPGAKADLAILDYQSPTPLVAANLGGHAVFGMAGRDVQTVIVDGRIVMEDRRFPWDTAGAFRAAREAAKKLWDAMDRL
jgi:putative selenium metabolism protein SsnA